MQRFMSLNVYLGTYMYYIHTYMYIAYLWRNKVNKLLVDYVDRFCIKVTTLDVLFLKKPRMDLLFNK